MENVIVGENIVTEMFQGSMGIKAVVLGSESVFTRPGGYFYLELNTKEEYT